MELKYKTVDFKEQTFKEDEKYFWFEGYLSTFGNIDRGGDVIEKGAFAESLKELIPHLFWMHKSDEPLGVYDSVVEDQNGLYVKGRLPKDDKFVSDRVIPQMKIGSIKSMSIGYSVKSSDVIFKDGVSFLKKVKLWEGSLVTLPMNDQAVLKSKAFKISDFDESKIRDIEKMFIEGVKFSNNDAKTFISFIKKGLGVDAEAKRRDVEEKKGWGSVLESLKYIKI